MIISVSILEHDGASFQRFYPQPVDPNPDTFLYCAFQYYDPFAPGLQCFQLLRRYQYAIGLHPAKTDAPINFVIVRSTIPSHPEHGGFRYSREDPFGPILSEEEFARWFWPEEKAQVITVSMGGSLIRNHLATFTYRDIPSRHPIHLGSFSSYQDLLLSQAVHKFDRNHFNFVYQRTKSIPKCVYYSH